MYYQIGIFSGKLHLKNRATIKNLFADKINDQSTIHFMTLTTDQTIDSSIYISKFLVNDIQANGVNRIDDFHKRVAIIGQENIVQGK